MRRFFLLFTMLGLLATVGFSAGKTDYKVYIHSKKGVFKTGLLFRDPRFNPRAHRVLKVKPAKKAIDYEKYKATACDNSQYLPPVSSQGAQGSCTAWAVGYYYKTYQENKEHNRTSLTDRADAHNICSPAYLYNLIHVEGDNGSYFGDAFRVLDDLGCCSLVDMPYSDSDYTTWPSTDAFKAGMYDRTQAPVGFSMNYLQLDSDSALDQVKQLLLNGDLVTFGISVYGNYDNISDYNNIYALADETGSNRGGHAQCIVGFDDTIDTPDGPGAFRVVNSWGPGWGDNGFYWISYEAIKYGSDLSGGYVFWVADRNNYQPSCYAVVNLSQPYSRQTVPGFVGSNGESFNFLDFYVNSDDYDYLPYPSTNIAVDLSDIHPEGSDFVTFEVNYNSDGDLDHGSPGTINFCQVNFIDTGDQYVSYDTPVHFQYASGGSATVYFTSVTYTITANATEGGSISPEGDCTVSEGAEKTFEIRAEEGYHIKDVLVDGTSIGVVNLYTFQDIASSHTIEAQFEVNQEFYPITATAVSQGGHIDPSGEVQVEHGTDQVFVIVPDAGYFINDVQVDGQSVGRVSSYSFTDVNASHSIKAWFSTSLPPEIHSAGTETTTVVAPATVRFACDAVDPDGGDIVQYIWEIQGAETEKILTESPFLNHVFHTEGVYTAKVTVVDDEGETATGELKDNRSRVAKITVLRPDALPVVIPSPVMLGKDKQMSFSSMNTKFLNTTDELTTLKLKYLGADGSVIAETTKEIPAYARLTLDGSAGIPENCSDVVAYLDNNILTYTALSTGTARMTAYLSASYRGSLFIPHIAEERAYWDSWMFLEDIQPGSVNIRVSGDDNKRDLQKRGNFVDLGALLPDPAGDNDGFGLVETVSNNPFQSQINSLSGLEMFVHNGTDGAAVELSDSGHCTLFLPHIPEETGIFWTGFTLVNTDDSTQANVHVRVYTGDGVLAGDKTLTIPAAGKTKVLMNELFPDLYGHIQWGMIQSDRPLVGIEIYGTADAAICGFSLPSAATTDGYLPEILNGDGLWSGIGITNPGNDDAHVTIQLVDKDGNVKAEKTELIGAKHRFTAVVSQLFDGTPIQDGDYVRYSSGAPVIGLVVSGDNDRTFMTALIGKK